MESGSGELFIFSNSFIFIKNVSKLKSTLKHWILNLNAFLIFSEYRDFTDGFR